MKRAIVLIGSLVLTLALGAPVGATHQGEGDRVTGKGTSGGFAFEVNARYFTTGGPIGEVHGQISLTEPTGVFVSGEVVCVAVMGNIATVLGRITEATQPLFVGGTVGLFLTDNGRSGTPPDEMGFFFSQAPPAPTCAAAAGFAPIDSGDIRIEDNA